MLIGVKIGKISCQEYTSTLSCGLWLRNESFPIDDLFLFVFGLVRELLFEFSELSGKQPSLGEKFVFLWVVFEHPLEVPCKVILASEGVHSREMIDALVWLHSV